MTPSDSVVHLTMRFNETKLAVGTGVFYRHEDSYYIVTAWHNVTGRHADTLKFLDAHTSAPNNILITFRAWSEELQLLFPHCYEIPIEDADSTFYLVHSQGYPRVDVAVIPIDPKKPYKLVGQLSTGDELFFYCAMSYPIENAGMTEIVPIQRFFPTDPQVREDFLSWLGQADELFIPGYPKGLTDYAVQPLWKRASVASAVEGGWNRQPKFLVDCASRQGMSGAPVLMYNKSGVIQYGPNKYVQLSPVAIFAGVYSGRLGEADALEAQIGVVWNWTVVDEIIEGGVYGQNSNFFLASEKEIEAAIAAYWPDQRNWNESVLDENKNHRARLLPTILRELNGRASEKEVTAAIVRYARDQLANQ